MQVEFQQRIDCQRAWINTANVLSRRVFDGEEDFDEVEQLALEHVEKCNVSICRRGRQLVREYQSFRENYPDSRFRAEPEKGRVIYKRNIVRWQNRIAVRIQQPNGQSLSR